MPATTTTTPSRFCEQHFAKLAIAVLALAVFNLGWRLNSEFVSEWDESLYATAAWEMVRSGHWIGTTFLGRLDYYNVKPPLNVWLIALAFKTFGINLVSMRIVSMASACGTVAVLQTWARPATRSAAVALLAGVVLSTSFAFVYVHAGRSGNTDALFTLLILLTVVAMWAAQDRPWAIAWLGPIVAAVFLLKGMAVLMPLAIVAVVEIWRRVHRRRREWLPVATALALFVLPVGAWIWQRWQLDQARFLERLFFYDFVDESLTPLEGHVGGPLFYLDVLQKYHYDWLLAAVAIVWIARRMTRDLRRQITFWPDSSETRVLLSAWAAATILIPTAMQTKNSWYVQPFYPLMALVVAWLIVHAFEYLQTQPVHAQRRMAVAVVLLAFAVAEGRLIAYSHWRRDLGQSTQGLLLAERERLSGHLVFEHDRNYADAFVVRALVGADQRIAGDVPTLLKESASGDFLIATAPVVLPEFALVRSNGHAWLYRRGSLPDTR